MVTGTDVRCFFVSTIDRRSYFLAQNRQIHAQKIQMSGHVLYKNNGTVIILLYICTCLSPLQKYSLDNISLIVTDTNVLNAKNYFVA